MPSPAPIVNIIRPQLTPEEQEARMEELKQAVAKFMFNVEKIRKAKGETRSESKNEALAQRARADGAASRKAG